VLLSEVGGIALLSTRLVVGRLRFHRDLPVDGSTKLFQVHKAVFQLNNQSCLICQVNARPN